MSARARTASGRASISGAASDQRSRRTASTQDAGGAAAGAAEAVSGTAVLASGGVSVDAGGGGPAKRRSAQPAASRSRARTTGERIDPAGSSKASRWGEPPPDPGGVSPP